MSTSRRIVLPFVLVAAVAGCEAGGPELETRTFGLQHLDGATAELLLMPYVYSDREENPGMLTATQQAVTVRESADNLDRIARVLEELDRAPPGIRLRFQVIEANGPGEPDPAIAEVEAELRELFRFEGYRLVAEGMVTPGQGGRFTTSLVGPEGDWRITGDRVPAMARAYGQNFAEPAPAAASTGTRLDDVTLWSEGGNEVVLRSSVTVHPGRTVVLGSARPPGGGSGAIILAVHAEVTNR